MDRYPTHVVAFFQGPPCWCCFDGNNQEKRKATHFRGLRVFDTYVRENQGHTWVCYVLQGFYGGDMSLATEGCEGKNTRQLTRFRWTTSSSAACWRTSCPPQPRSSTRPRRTGTWLSERKDGRNSSPKRCLQVHSLCFCCIVLIYIYIYIIRHMYTCYVVLPSGGKWKPSMGIFVNI